MCLEEKSIQFTSTNQPQQIEKLDRIVIISHRHSSRHSSISLGRLCGCVRFGNSGIDIRCIGFGTGIRNLLEIRHTLDLAQFPSSVHIQGVAFLRQKFKFTMLDSCTSMNCLFEQKKHHRLVGHCDNTLIKDQICLYQVLMTNFLYRVIHTQRDHIFVYLKGEDIRDLKQLTDCNWCVGTYQLVSRKRTNVCFTVMLRMCVHTENNGKSQIIIPLLNLTIQNKHLGKTGSNDIYIPRVHQEEYATPLKTEVGVLPYVRHAVAMNNDYSNVIHCLSQATIRYRNE